MNADTMLAKENELLKKENELLKREIDLMKREYQMKMGILSTPICNEPISEIDVTANILPGRVQIVPHPDEPILPQFDANDTARQYKNLKYSVYNDLYKQPSNKDLPFNYNEYGSLFSRINTCKNTCA